MAACYSLFLLKAVIWIGSSIFEIVCFSQSLDTFQVTENFLSSLDQWTKQFSLLISFFCFSEDFDIIKLAVGAPMFLRSMLRIQNDSLCLVLAPLWFDSRCCSRTLRTVVVIKTAMNRHWTPSCGSSQFSPRNFRAQQFSRTNYLRSI